MPADITDVHGRFAALVSQTVNDQTGTSYTIAQSDVDGIVTATNGSAITVTLPPNASVNIPVGSTVTIAQLGAGQVTVAAGAGVTLRAAPTAKVLGQYSVVRATKIATNTWILSGAIAAS